MGPGIGRFGYISFGGPKLSLYCSNDCCLQVLAWTLLTEAHPLEWGVPWLPLPNPAPSACCVEPVVVGNPSLCGKANVPCCGT